MDWMDLAQDRDQWRVLVNTVMNFKVHKVLGISRIVHNLRLLRKGSAPLVSEWIKMQFR
jgi:hypothetical protein